MFFVVSHCLPLFFFILPNSTKGIAFVDFATVDQLNAAMSKVFSLGGRDLRIKVAEKRSRKPREDRGGGGGFGNSGGGFGGQKRSVMT